MVITERGLELTPPQAEGLSDVMALTATAMENRYRVPRQSGARLAREPNTEERKLAAQLASDVRPRRDNGDRPVVIARERLETVGSLSALALANAPVLHEDLASYYASQDYEGLVIPEVEHPLDLVAAIQAALENR